MTVEGEEYKNLLLSERCVKYYDGKELYQAAEICCEVCGKECRSPLVKSVGMPTCWIVCDECRQKIESLQDPTYEQVATLFLI